MYLGYKMIAKSVCTVVVFISTGVKLVVYDWSAAMNQVNTYGYSRFPYIIDLWLGIEIVYVQVLMLQISTCG